MSRSGCVVYSCFPDLYLVPGVSQDPPSLVQVLCGDVRNSGEGLCHHQLDSAPLIDFRFLIEATA